MSKPIRIFFVTDVHGSNVCYRKFLNALKAYKVDVGILLGDLTGKVLVPLVEKAGGGWETTLMGHHTEANSQEELEKLKKTIEMMGYYWVHQTPEEFKCYRDDPALVDTLFKQLMLQRLREWIALADERLTGTGYKVYMAPGNDDHFEVDQVIEDSAAIVNCNNKNVMLGDHEMITFCWTNPKVLRFLANAQCLVELPHQVIDVGDVDERPKPSVSVTRHAGNPKSLLRILSRTFQIRLKRLDD